MLLNAALWELLRDTSSLNDEQLREKVEEIDLRDGMQDGKMRLSVQVCSGCKRKINGQRDRCIYCGEKASGSPFK